MHLSNLTKSILYFLSIIFLIPTVSADGMPEDTVKNSVSAEKNSSVAMTNEQLAKFQYCGRDSDCIEVINGCCQCLQGDKYVAIAKNRYKDFKMSFNCENVSCPKEENVDNCKEGVLSCINHQCTYFQGESE